MKFDDRFVCQACAAVFRPTRGEELCPKCEAAEQRRLDEIGRELNARAYREKARCI